MTEYIYIHDIHDIHDISENIELKSLKIRIIYKIWNILFNFFYQIK